MTVIEVGPVTVRGAPAESAAAAIDCIDDDLAVLDDRPVAVDELWHEVLAGIGGSAADSAVLVCPTWWPEARIARVTAAGERALPDVSELTVLRRADALRVGRRPVPMAVVEIAPELVVVAGPEGLHAVARVGDPKQVARAVVATVGTCGVVVIDAPPDVDGAVLLASGITELLRAARVSVSIAEVAWTQRLSITSRDAQAPHRQGRPPARGSRGRAVLGAAGLCVAALCIASAVAAELPEQPPPGEPVALLVEGRVGVTVPALWSVQRVVSGPGSARLQVVSPADEETAVHITQAPLTTFGTLPQTLRAALDDQPAGVFSDFDPAGSRGGRPAITYRENRPGHRVDWAVLVDDDVRIGIGCQSAPGREPSVRDACDAAVRSAHAVF